MACKKEDAPNSNENSRKISDKGSLEFEFEFPDTVLLNKPYKGKIRFKGVFDSISTNVMEPVNGIDRYIIYCATQTKSIDYDFKELKRVKLDTFGAIDNRTILLDNIVFREVGVQYIDGILNDHVTIDTLKRPLKPTDKVRYLEKEVRVTHKVFVLAK